MTYLTENGHGWWCPLLEIIRAWCDSFSVDYDEGPCGIEFMKENTPFWFMIEADGCSWDTADPSADILVATAAERDALLVRRDELLAAMKRLGGDVPYEDEKGKLAMLMAEVGTLKARVLELGMTENTLRERATYVETLLGNLLAVIHRDGGHHQGAVGITQACVDAEAKVAGYDLTDGDRADLERYRNAFHAQLDESAKTRSKAEHWNAALPFIPRRYFDCEDNGCSYSFVAVNLEHAQKLLADAGCAVAETDKGMEGVVALEWSELTPAEAEEKHPRCRDDENDRVAPLTSYDIGMWFSSEW